MKRIAVIGAGIFGCSAALALSPEHEVEVFDQATSILSGASTLNHLRYHRGYHYPRSPETVAESLQARNSFGQAYGKAIVGGFPAYYGVSRENTKTTPSAYLDFCKKMNLACEIEYPEENMMNRNKVSLVVRTGEEVYDPRVLQALVLSKCASRGVQINLASKLVKCEGSNTKNLTFQTSRGRQNYEADVVINATYTGLNTVNNILGLPRKESFYELVELLEVSHPNFSRVGLTIIDGEFSSLLPRGSFQTYTLGHVRESILDGVVTDNPEELLKRNYGSRKEAILAAGTDDFPFLRDAKVVRSIFIPRVVKAHVDATDRRPTEVTDHGNGLYSIFAGKVVTAVNAAEKLKSMIDSN